MMFFFPPNKSYSTARGTVCDCGLENNLQHHAGHISTQLHVCCHGGSAFQGIHFIASSFHNPENRIFLASSCVIMLYIDICINPCRPDRGLKIFKIGRLASTEF